jgi:hypothetical protein
MGHALAMSGKWNDVCGKGLVSNGNDANQPVARHFNSGIHIVFHADMRIRAFCPISGSNDSRKKHEMPLFSKVGNERFSYV